MLLSNGPKRVSLISENGQFQTILGGKQVVYQESTERFWVYLLFQKNARGEFAKELRGSVKFELSPMEVDRFIDDFIDAHFVQEANEYSFKILPWQSDKDNGLILPIPGYTCVISREHEDALMSILSSYPNAGAYPKLVEWFKRFCDNYGYDFQKKCKGMQYDFFAQSFLEQEGIDPDNLPPILTYTQDNQNSGLSVAAMSVIFTVLAVVLGPILFWLGVKICDWANGYFGLLAGVILAGLGVYLFGLGVGWNSYDDIFGNRK